MTIPSEDEFNRLPRMPVDGYMQHSALLHDGSWDGIYGPHDELSLPYVIKALSEIRESRRRYIEQTYALPVMKWLDGNPTSERAWNALWKKRGASEYVVEDHAERLLEHAMAQRTEDFYQHPGFRFRDRNDLERRLAQDNSTAGRISRLRRVLRKHASWDPMGDARAVAAAFRGYFYCSSHLQYCVRADDRHAEAKILLEAIRRLEDPERWRKAGVPAPPLIRLSRTAQEDLQAAVSGKLTPPIKKVDETAPERALAFELWSHCMRVYRANKATAIYNFMQFEGVRNPPDPRSVERWIKDWRERKVALAPVTKDG